MLDLANTANTTSHSLSWSGIVGLFAITGILVFMDFFVLGNVRHGKGGFKKAAINTGLYAALAGAFAIFILLTRGARDAAIFTTGYLLEYSLSVDNVFIFLLIVKSCNIEAKNLPKIISIGVLMTMILRMIFIAIGATLVQKYQWIVLIFAFILLNAAMNIIMHAKHGDADHHNILNGKISKTVKKIFRIKDIDAPNCGMYTILNGKIFGTKNLMATIMIIVADIVCAVDSIPAILTITQDSFLIYTSNLFAVLGLRSMYVALQNIMQMAPHLEYGLAFLLFFIGAKMIINAIFGEIITINLSLLVSCTAIISMIVYTYISVRKKSK